MGASIWHVRGLVDEVCIHIRLMGAQLASEVRKWWLLDPRDRGNALPTADVSTRLVFPASGSAGLSRRFS